MASASCGEAQGTLEDSPPQVRQAKAPLTEECASAVVPERELVIQDRGVLNDAARTGWSGTLSTDRGAADGAWNFGRLMARMSGPVAPEAFARDWLARGETGPAANGQGTATRSLISQVISAWPKHADGTLDLTKSPMRLRAIVNHMDARDVSRGSAGEGHLVFGVLDASGNPLNLTVTLAYDLPARTQAEVRDWAQRWHALATLTPGTGQSGTHVIVAVASDRAGNVRRSNAVTVTVP